MMNRLDPYSVFTEMDRGFEGIDSKFEYPTMDMKYPFDEEKPAPTKSPQDEAVEREFADIDQETLMTYYGMPTHLISALEEN